MVACRTHPHIHTHTLALSSALHLAIIHNHQDVVLQLLDVLPQLPPTETPVVDCLNNLKQVCTSVYSTWDVSIGVKMSECAKESQNM